MALTRQTAERSALAVIEEAVWTLRDAPFAVTVSYYVGSLPFWIALLYFWGDMQHSAFAAQRCSIGAFGLALLFVWMKVWHVLFAAAMRSRLEAAQAPHWSAAALLQAAGAQALIHATACILLPLSIIATLPFGWVYAFYQSASVVAPERPGLRQTAADAWQAAGLWPKQNHIIIWLLSPLLLMLTIVAIVFLLYLIPLESVSSWASLGITALLLWLVAMIVLAAAPLSLVLALNIGALLLLLPYLLKTLLGVETTISMNLLGVVSTPTFLLIVLTLTHLFLDPLLKTVYVVRCYYGRARTSGEDLQARFNALTRPKSALLVAGLLLMATTATAAAETAPVEPAALDAAIEDVLQQREFAWRLPHDVMASDTVFLKAFLEALFEPIADFVNWLGKRLERLFDRFRHDPPATAATAADWIAVLHGVLYLLVTLLIGLLIVCVWHRCRQRRRQSEVTAAPLAAAPDLEDETVSAADLPEDAWARLAAEMIERGDLRLALRALFLSSLVSLSARHLVQLASAKSNREYARELQRRAHALPELTALFESNLGIFEHVWYGTLEPDRELLHRFVQNTEKMTANV